jgi:hypothetical protein
VQLPVDVFVSKSVKKLLVEQDKQELKSLEQQLEHVIEH